MTSEGGKLNNHKHHWTCLLKTMLSTAVLLESRLPSNQLLLLGSVGFAAMAVHWKFDSIHFMGRWGWRCWGDLQLGHIALSAIWYSLWCLLSCCNVVATPPHSQAQLSHRGETYVSSFSRQRPGSCSIQGESKGDSDYCKWMKVQAVCQHYQRVRYESMPWVCSGYLTHQSNQDLPVYRVG